MEKEAIHLGPAGGKSHETGRKGRKDFQISKQWYFRASSYVDAGFLTFMSYRDVYLGMWPSSAHLPTFFLISYTSMRNCQEFT